MTAKLIGIVGLLGMTTVVARTATVVDKVAEDGLQPTDIQYLPEAYAAVSPLLNIKYSELLAECNDLDADERQQLAETFKREFDLKSDATEELIEDGIELLIDGAVTIKNLYVGVVVYIGKVKAFRAKFA